MVKLGAPDYAQADSFEGFLFFKNFSRTGWAYALIQEMAAFVLQDLHKSSQDAISVEHGDEWSVACERKSYFKENLCLWESWVEKFLDSCF